MKQTPRLLYSDMTNSVYIVTEYRILDDKGHFLAIKKIDVTKEFELMALRWLNSNKYEKKEIKENDPNSATLF